MQTKRKITTRPSGLVGNPRRVVEGCRLPDDRPELSVNERDWIQFLRAIAGDRDPPVTLKAIQALQLALAPDPGDGR